MPDPTVQRPRGARPSPRNKLAAALPYRVRGSTPPQFIVVPKQLSMWLNDTQGDCVTAEEAAAKAMASVMAGQSEIFIQDATVQAWASAHGVLNGADLASVLEWMQSAGFSQDGDLYNDGPHQSVDWTSPAVLQNAISQGPVKIGVAAAQLESVVGNGNGWFGVGFSKDTNEDHCVNLCGFGPMSWLAAQLGVSVPSGVDGTQQGYALYTWKTIGIIDVPSLLAICGEAWLRSPTTVVVGPNGPPPVPIPTPVPVPTPTPGGGPTQAQVQAAVDAGVLTGLQQTLAKINPYLRHLGASILSAAVPVVTASVNAEIASVFAAAGVSPGPSHTIQVQGSVIIDGREV
jgi:hypothetical protein